MASERMKKQTVTFKRYAVLEGYGESVCHCMKKAQEEDPEGAKSWTPEQLEKKGADWAARHLIIGE